MIAGTKIRKRKGVVTCYFPYSGRQVFLTHIGADRTWKNTGTTINTTNEQRAIMQQIGRQIRQKKAEV